MRDLHNHIKPVRAISPVSGGANDTAIVSQIIDRKGYDALEFVIATGSLADADATFTVLIEDGDNSALSDNVAVVDAELLGTEVLAGFRFDSDDGVRKIGYIGNKRYVRMTITPSGNTGAWLVAVVALLTKAADQPVS